MGHLDATCRSPGRGTIRVKTFRVLRAEAGKRRHCDTTKVTSTRRAALGESGTTPAPPEERDRPVVLITGWMMSRSRQKVGGQKRTWTASTLDAKKLPPDQICVLGRDNNSAGRRGGQPGYEARIRRQRCGLSVSRGQVGGSGSHTDV